MHTKLPLADETVYHLGEFLDFLEIPAFVLAKLLYVVQMLQAFVLSLLLFSDCLLQHRNLLGYAELAHKLLSDHEVLLFDDQMQLGLLLLASSSVMLRPCEVLEL